MSSDSSQRGGESGETPPQPIISLLRRPATTFDELDIPNHEDVPEPKEGVVAAAIRRAKTLKARNVPAHDVPAHEDEPKPKKGLGTAIRRVKTLKASLKLGIKSSSAKKKERGEGYIALGSTDDLTSTASPKPKFPSPNYTTAENDDIPPLALPPPAIRKSA